MAFDRALLCASIKLYPINHKVGNLDNPKESIDVRWNSSISVAVSQSQKCTVCIIPATDFDFDLWDVNTSSANHADIACC